MIRVDVSGGPPQGPSWFTIPATNVQGFSNNDILSGLEQHICPDIESVYHIKCLYKGKRIGDLHTLSPNPLFSTQRQNKVSVLLTRRNTAEKIHAMKETHARVPDMEYEFERERRRREYGSSVSGTRVNTRVGSLRPFRYTTVDVYPGSEDAVKLLKMIVDDPGIRHVMDTYDWKIGTVSEMPPEGMVGVSPVCILGVNIDCGREISLRLRTDDLRGFRKFDMIRSTMIHELAHMRYSEHDDDFKRFNRELSDLAQRVTASHGQRVSRHAVKAYPESSVPKHPNQPHTFTENEWSRVPGQHARAAAAAAAAAALKRDSSHVGPQSFPLAVDSSSRQESIDVTRNETFEKGEDVLYFNKRADVWQEARVISVDSSVQPPSYGIEMIVSEQEQPIQRETEGSRLKKCEESIKGMNHKDTKTNQLEDRVARLLE